MRGIPAQVPPEPSEEMFVEALRREHGLTVPSPYEPQRGTAQGALQTFTMLPMNDKQIERFHHRSTQEYLAARRLLSLRRSGMSTKALLRLLFSTCYGVDVVFPSMRAIAAWLALWDDSVRDALVRLRIVAVRALVACDRDGDVDDVAREVLECPADWLGPRKSAGMRDVITCTSEGDDLSGRRRRGVNRPDA